jgi:hypothetical protein
MLELVSQRRGRRLVQQGHAFCHPALGDERQPFSRHAHCLER